MPRFDRLFASVVQPGETPESLREKLSVEGVQRLHGPFPKGFRGLLTKYRKLGQPARMKAALEYLTRNPPPKTFEEKRKKQEAEAPRIFRAFIHDQCAPSCSFYDAHPCMYVAREDAKDEGKVYWEARHPFNLRVHLWFPFKSISEILTSLIRLAARLGLAFRTDGKKTLADVHTRYGVVLMPVGDRRAAVLAGKPENAHECEGMPPGTALLFVEEFPENIGMISEWHAEYPKKTGIRYGCFVFGRFYAIELDSFGFDREPRIPV